MPAAIIGGAIAAVGAVGSAVISSKGASNAAKATQAGADRASDVQTQIYNQNAQALQPWQQTGLRANSAINSLLGIGEQQPPQMNGGQGMAGQMAGPRDGMVHDMWGGPGMTGTQSVGEMQFGGGQTGGYQPSNALTPAAQNPQQQYQSAFDNYRNSTGYQFRLNQGMNAINSGYAGAGTLQSGAAMKAINDYGQGMASQEFGNYMNALGNQQGIGFSAASAQAGVGQNYANSIGNIAMQNGANQANAALVKSQNTAGAISSVANIAGNLYGRYG